MDLTMFHHLFHIRLMTFLQPASAPDNTQAGGYSFPESCFLFDTNTDHRSYQNLFEENLWKIIKKISGHCLCPTQRKSQHKQAKRVAGIMLISTQFSKKIYHIYSAVSKLLIKSPYPASKTVRRNSEKGKKLQA